MDKAVGIVIALILVSGCAQKSEPKEPPAEIPKGILVKEIPAEADLMFDSIRYVLQDEACLDENYYLKERFIHDPLCNPKIYVSAGYSASRQLYYMDLETKEVTQVTNTDCSFVHGQVLNGRKNIMVHAACSDTNGDGIIANDDETELYIIDLQTEEKTCLTCEFDLLGINNPDYSPVNEKIVFSSHRTRDLENHLYTIDADKTLIQLTNDSSYWEFDCAWNEDATKIAVGRVVEQELPLTIPSQVWIMNSNGSGLEKITDGGPNEGNEGPSRGYPIGVDVDPDFSRDSKKIVFSRLKTGQINGQFGVWELVIVDIVSRETEVLDSAYANMIPVWSEKGILVVRQVYDSEDPASSTQGLVLYKDGTFTELEENPYNVFPIGAQSVSWIR
jgi:hypothetical protein